MEQVKNVLVLNGNIPNSNRLTDRSYIDIGGNIGNCYITYSIAKMLGSKYTCKYILNNIWCKPARDSVIRESLSEFQWAFIILQDQIRLGIDTDYYYNALLNLNELREEIKLVAVSVGANSFGEGSTQLVSGLTSVQRRFFDFLATRCLSIGVRGAFTADVLERMGISNYRVTGCPTYFECGSGRLVEAPRERSNRQFLGLTGSFRLPEHKNVEFFLQGDAEWPLIKLMHAPVSVWRDEIGKGVAEQETGRSLLDAVAKGRVYFFSDFSAWKDRIRRDCKLVCGTRLHGAILALNAGVPAIVTSGDARAQETCELLGIPYHPEFNGRDLTCEQLESAADPAELNDLYEIRRQIFLDWLNAVGLDIGEPEKEPTYSSYKRLPKNVIAKRVQVMLGDAKV